MLSRLTNNSYYEIFTHIYANNSNPWPWIYYFHKQGNFLCLNFLHCSLSCYNGFEIAVFDGKHVVSYWLPGAQSKAQGHVAPGLYNIELISPINGEVINLIIEKDDLDIKLISHNITKVDNNIILKTHRINGNMINYKLFEPELKELVKYWLSTAKNTVKSNIYNHKNILQ